jgi:hypothetical protein
MTCYCYLNFFNNQVSQWIVRVAGTDYRTIFGFYVPSAGWLSKSRHLKTSGVLAQNRRLKLSNKPDGLTLTLILVSGDRTP